MWGNSLAHFGHLRLALSYVARHTGIPVVVVAGIAIVLSWRLARKLARLFLEVSLAAAFVFALTQLGLIAW